MRRHHARAADAAARHRDQAADALLRPSARRTTANVLATPTRSIGDRRRPRRRGRRCGAVRPGRARRRWRRTASGGAEPIARPRSANRRTSVGRADVDGRTERRDAVDVGELRRRPLRPRRRAASRRATDHPSRASSSPVCRPIPCVPPVTTATGRPSVTARPTPRPRRRRGAGCGSIGDDPELGAGHDPRERIAEHPDLLAALEVARVVRDRHLDGDVAAADQLGRRAPSRSRSGRS